MNKMIYGNVNSNGKKETGIDFTVEHKATGVYLITFSIPFPTVPTLLVTQNHPKWDDFTSGGGKTTDNAVIIAVSKSEARIKTGDSKGDAADRNFSFLAICEIPT